MRDMRDALTMRIAVVGKGGAGKSMVAGTLTRLLASEGRRRVLALDSDLMPGLALSLGAQEPAEPPLLNAVEKDERGRWRMRKGIGPVRAVQRFSTPAPDGVRLLQTGKLGPEGLPAIIGAANAFYSVVHGLSRARAFADWAIVGDLPAGPRQLGFDWAPYAETFLVVAEPSVKSALAARRVIRVARARGRTRVLLVANKVTEPSEAHWLASRLGMPLFATIPADDEVARAELRGLAPLDAAPACRAVAAVSELATRLEGSHLERARAA